MLVIILITFMKKKTELVIAYGMLATAATIVVAHDAHIHRLPAKTVALAPDPHAPAAPLPLTRLADSPFLKSTRQETDPTPLAVVNRESGTPGPINRQSAPFGVYFLRTAVQADSVDGPVTFGAGTQVRLVRHQAGKMRVTRNGTDFLVEESQLTNDLETVAALAGTSS